MGTLLLLASRCLSIVTLLKSNWVGQWRLARLHWGFSDPTVLGKGSRMSATSLERKKGIHEIYVQIFANATLHNTR